MKMGHLTHPAKLPNMHEQLSHDTKLYAAGDITSRHTARSVWPQGEDTPECSRACWPPQEWGEDRTVSPDDLL